MHGNPILTSANAALAVTSNTAANPIYQLVGLPLGTVGGTATAEIGVKTILLGGGAAVIGHVIVDSGTITTVSAVTAITNALPAGTNAIGQVSTTPKQTSAVPSSFTPATADATVFTLAAGERGFIQNLSADAPLAVKKGAAASTSSFSLILAACTAQDDGKGGYTFIENWIGAVSVAKITGTARYIAWKETV